MWKKINKTNSRSKICIYCSIITAKRSDVYGELMAFIIKQRSSKENFTIIPPELEDARGVEVVRYLLMVLHFSRRHNNSY